MFQQRPDTGSLAQALHRAVAVVDVLSEDLAHTVPRLPPPNADGEMPTAATRRCAQVELEAVERELRPLEAQADIAREEAHAWQERAARAADEGRADMAAQAQVRADAALREVEGYAAELGDARAFVNEWSAYLRRE